MTNSLRLAGFLAVLSVGLSAAPSHAANRAFPAIFGVPESPSSGCFSHSGGYAAMRNTCSGNTNVFLPMSFDAAGWYTLSIYGQGWIDANNNRNTIACTANYVMHDNRSLGMIAGNGWVSLASNGFGGPQSLLLGWTPIYDPGDAAYGYCVMQPRTTLFTYGWN